MNLHRRVQYKPEVLALFQLTVPILATQLAQVGMGTVDTIVAGRASTLDLAAVAIGTAVWLPVWMLLAGILAALAPMVAKEQARLTQVGLPPIEEKGKTEVSSSGPPTSKRLIQLLLTGRLLGAFAGAVLGLLIAALALVLPMFIDSPATAEVSREYLLAISVGFPATGFFLAYRFFAESTDRAFRVTLVMLVGLVANVPFSWLLVYGGLGLPALGGMGCGLATSLVFFCMAFAIPHLIPCPSKPDIWNGLSTAGTLTVASRPMENLKNRLGYRLLLPSKQMASWNSKIAAEILRVGLPIGAAIFFEVSLFTVIALFLTEFGPATVAGHQVALNVASITFMIPLSVGLALTVRVGHHTGTSRFEQARSSAWLGIKLNLLLAALNAAVILAFAKSISELYSLDPLVVTIAAHLLVFAAIFQVSDAMQIAAAGALRGYQDTWALMMITLITYWGIGLGSGWLLAFHGVAFWNLQPMGVEGFWIGLILGLTAAAFGLSWRLWQVVEKHMP
jgi:MATE family multidrug resistance protein